MAPAPADYLRAVMAELKKFDMDHVLPMHCMSLLMQDGTFDNEDTGCSNRGGGSLLSNTKAVQSGLLILAAGCACIVRLCR